MKITTKNGELTYEEWKKISDKLDEIQARLDKCCCSRQQRSHSETDEIISCLRLTKASEMLEDQK